MSLKDRLMILKELRCVDEVVVNTGDEDSKPAILVAKPTHILHGDDWTGSSLLKQMGLTRAFLKEQKIKLLYLPYTKGISTTKIIARIHT